MMRPMLWILVCVMAFAVASGCKKSGGPPIAVREVQVQAEYLAEGYDIYKYVAIKDQKDNFPDTLMELLTYYETLYAKEGKVKVMVFPDAASAIQAISDRVLAELEMENGKVIRKVVNTR